MSTKPINNKINRVPSPTDESPLEIAPPIPGHSHSKHGGKHEHKPTPEESRKAFKVFQKGKGRAHDIPGHANSCTKCNHAASLAASVMDPTKPPTMSPDCILYSQPTAYIPARAPKCFCPKTMTASMEDTYATLHHLFLRRLRLHDLPIVFYEEVAELEKTMVPEMIRDAMLGKGFGGESDIFSDGPHYYKTPGKKKRKKTFRLSEYPDAEARLEMREELVSLLKVLGKELMFDSTAPLVLEELAYCGDVHGYSSLTHGPPCACVLNTCNACLKVLAQRLIPSAPPQPLPRAPPDHAFLMYSAKALKMQYLNKETTQAMNRYDWEEELKACQKRTGDVLWQTAMELDLGRVTKDVIGIMERAYDEDFYKNLIPMYRPDTGHEKESFKPVREAKAINNYLEEISIDFEDEIIAEKEKAEKEKEKGNSAYKRGMFRRAVKHFTKAMQLDPCEPVYPLNRALALIKLEKFKTAEKDCTICINLNPRSTKALYRRALSRRGLDQLVEAEIDLNLVLAIEPTNQAAIIELKEVRQELRQTPGSSSQDPSELQARVPPLVDSPTSMQERQESESYWKERFVSTVHADDGLHRGATGKPCVAFNRAKNGCPLGRKCNASHAPDEYSLRVNAFNRNVCTNHLLGRACQPEDYNKDGKQPSLYICPYMHAVSEEDKKTVWNEMQDIADRLRTDMGLDMKVTQDGFLSEHSAMEAISNMRASVSADQANAGSASASGSGLSHLASSDGSIPPEIKQMLLGMQGILEKKSKSGDNLGKMGFSFELPLKGTSLGSSKIQNSGITGRPIIKAPTGKSNSKNSIKHT